jgi:ribosomal protein S18 acetylase RimI-like enzyme
VSLTPFATVQLVPTVAPMPGVSAAFAPPRRSDRSGIEALYARSVRANPEEFIQELSFHGPIFELLSGFAASGGAAEILRLNADGPVIGMGALRVTAPEVAELCKLHLDSPFHGLGLGRRLTERLLTQAKQLGRRRVDLHVTATQRAAISLYLRLGFTVTEIRPCPVEVDGETVVFETLFMSLWM